MRPISVNLWKIPKIFLHIWSSHWPLYSDVVPTGALPPPHLQALNILVRNPLMAFWDFGYWKFFRLSDAEESVFRVLQNGKIPIFQRASRPLHVFLSRNQFIGGPHTIFGRAPKIFGRPPPKKIFWCTTPLPLYNSALKKSGSTTIRRTTIHRIVVKYANKQLVSVGFLAKTYWNNNGQGLV